MYYIPRDIWIEKSDNQSEILKKLVSAPTYNINPQDQDIDSIYKIAKTYDKVSKDIALWLQHL